MWLGLLFGCSTSLPRFEVTAYDPDRVEQGYLLGSLLGEEPALFIADRDGQVLWMHPGQVGVLNPVVAMARDGHSLLYNEFAEDRTVDIGAVNRLGLDGIPGDSTRTESAHHTFTELPDGTVAYLGIDVREVESYGGVVGDRVVEVHPDGTVSQVFTAWEHFNVVPHQYWGSDFYPQGHDWTHGNALFYDEASDSYLVSFRNLSAFVEVDRASGEVTRQFGGQNPDLRPDLSQGFSYQHGVHWTADGTILLTSSGRLDDGELETWASEYAVDEDSGTMEEIWTYGRGLGIHAYALGEAHRLPHGNTLVNWGTAGLLREISQDGEVLWEMVPEEGAFFGRTWFLEDISGLF
jgi:hypothetical protein